MSVLLYVWVSCTCGSRAVSFFQTGSIVWSGRSSLSNHDLNRVFGRAHLWFGTIELVPRLRGHIVPIRRLRIPALLFWAAV